ncbi:MAG: NADH-quinone oxidoreductase subunit C [Deltaproteobacteria bacterium]|nr:NADH-quinone oxidoreductase subunit C [Deltaproteobacteria bacterium]
MTVIDENHALVKRPKETFPAAILETNIFRNEVTHIIGKDWLIDMARFLKGDKDLKMNYLSDIAGVDYFPRTPRFEVVYHFYSVSKKLRLRLKVRIEDNERVPSLTGLWRSAAVAEREVFDMFGIVFEGHEGLRRIYLPADWDGFPLRKDYPLRGYKDQYNPSGEEKK